MEGVGVISGEFEGPVAAAAATATASRPAPPRLSRYPRHVNGQWIGPLGIDWDFCLACRGTHESPASSLGL